MAQGRALTMDGFLQEWLKPGGVGFGIGGFLMWLLSFRATRDDVKQKRLDAAFSAYTKKVEERCKELEQRCDAADRRADEMHRALIDCEKKHLESDRKIMEMDAKLQAAGLARQMAQQAIAADKLKEREE